MATCSVANFKITLSVDKTTSGRQDSRDTPPPATPTATMSNDSSPFKFSSVELLSLYTTTVLQQLVTVVQPIEERLLHLIEVLEYNLNNMEVDKRWFFGTLRDHARLFSKEWKLGNTDGPDLGKVAYNTLLLVVALRLGLEKLWVNDGNTPVINGMVMEELATLFHPKKITLAIKQLNKNNPLFDFLSSHSPDLEKVNMHRSDAAAFQDSMKFKSLRVLELGGRISDKVLCIGLWNINKKSDKVLEVALKDNKGPESWQLSLPNLEIFRNNVVGDPHTHSMRVSLGSAALLIQPKMEIVETLTWDTNRAILNLLETEAKLKNSRVDRKFRLTKLLVRYHEHIDMEKMTRLFKACPSITDLTLIISGSPLKHMSLLLGTIPAKQIKRLELYAQDLDHMEFTVLLAAMPNLSELFLHITPDAIANNQEDFQIDPDATVSYHPTHPDRTLQEWQEMLPHNIESLSLDFAGTDMNIKESLENEEFAAHMISFLQNFPAVRKMYFYNTVFLPPPFLIFGCIGGALATLRKMSHITVQSYDEDIPRDKLTDPEDSACLFPIIDPHHVQTHYMKAILMFPLLQKETTFQYLRLLESFELDEQYFSPRVDRMVAALRAAGVLVNGLYSTATVEFPNDFGGKNDSMTIDNMIRGALNT